MRHRLGCTVGQWEPSPTGERASRDRKDRRVTVSKVNGYL